MSQSTRWLIQVFLKTSHKKFCYNLRPMRSKVYYPIFLDIAGKRCVIVGGGRVAERKCSSLIKAGARVTVISPEITGRLAAYKEKGMIKHIPRSYRRGDIRSAFLVIAAAGSEETNQRVAEEAKGGNKLLNVVDTPSLCNFIAPSVVKRGLLTIAISTGGASPAMAKEIRKDLQKIYGPEYARYLNFLRDARSKAMKEIPDKKEREKFLKELAAKVKKRRNRNESFKIM